MVYTKYFSAVNVNVWQVVNQIGLIYFHLYSTYLTLTSNDLNHNYLQDQHQKPGIRYSGLNVYQSSTNKWIH